LKTTNPAGDKALLMKYHKRENGKIDYHRIQRNLPCHALALDAP
jgi:hypothetical protein